MSPSRSAWVVPEAAGATQEDVGLRSTPDNDLTDRLWRPDAASETWLHKFAVSLPGLVDGGTEAFAALGTDGEGNVVFAIRGAGLDFGAGPQADEVHLVKVDRCGNLVWSRGFDAMPVDLAITRRGDIVVVGHVDRGGDVFGVPLDDGAVGHDWIARLDAAGNVSWVHHWQNDGSCWAVAVDSVGNAFIGGSFAGAVRIGPARLGASGAIDGYLAAFDPAGDVGWAQQIGASCAAVEAVAVGPSDEIVVAGFLQGEQLAWGLGVPGPGSHAFVAKLGTDDAVQWSATFGVDDFVNIHDVAIDAAGGITVCGQYGSGLDLGGGPLPSMGRGQPTFFARFSPTGEHAWSRSAGGLFFACIAGRANGNVVVTASVHRPTTIDALAAAPLGPGDSQLLFGELDASGAWLGRTLHGGCFTMPCALAVDAFDAVVGVGMFLSYVDFGSALEVTNSDSYVAHLVRIP